MYADTDSTTYATVTNSRTSTSSYYIYVRGFNFDDVPSNAVVSDFTIRLKGYYSGGYSQNMYLYDGTSTSMGSASSLDSSADTYDFTCNYSWEDVVAAGSDFGIRINCRRASRNTTSYIYIYGAEIEVTYTIPTPRSLTVSLSGNGTVSPSGTSTVYDGDEVEITITPTTKTDTVTITHNGTDVSSQLVAHGPGSTITAVPDNVTTSSVQSGSSYAEYAVGYSAESPSSSGTSSNMYASSDSTGYAEYTFDFSGIPSGAVIEDIEVRCYGHRESSTIDSTHVSQCAIYDNGTAISDAEDFPSTSNSIITLTPTTMPSSMDNVTVRHFVGYYGGLVLGISFVVTYSTGTGLDHYTYTFTVSGDATIAVVIGAAATQKFYVKQNGTWVEDTSVVAVYKKVNGSWVEQSDWSSAFDTNTKYVIG